MGMKFNVWVFMIFVLPLMLRAENENLNVLGGIKFSDVENALYHYYSDKVFEKMDQREKEVAACKTVADWKKRQRKVRGLFKTVVGDFFRENSAECGDYRGR
jgi:hypothetical protein